MTELTRKEAVKIAGGELIKLAENDNCEHSGLVTDGTPYHGFDIWKGSAEDENNRVVAVYLQDSEESKNLAPDDMEWNVDHYTVESL